MIKPEITEKEFDTFFDQISYTRVSTDIINHPPNFKNADYVNKLDNIIVELKIIEKEHFPEGGVINSLSALIIQPKQIDGNGFGQYTFSIPDENREGKYDNFEEPLRRTLKTANKQLRETKDFYQIGNNIFTGYVVLAQTGLTSLSPDITAILVQKILNSEFSSIDGVIICTPHGILRNPMNGRYNPACMSVTKNHDIRLTNQCKQIADNWCKFFDNGGHSKFK